MSTPRGTLDEVRAVMAGLWLWRVRHPLWSPGLEWQPVVTSTCVESNGEVALLDPIAPPDDARALWNKLDARGPPGTRNGCCQRRGHCSNSPSSTSSSRTESWCTTGPRTSEPWSCRRGPLMRRDEEDRPISIRGGKDRRKAHGSCRELLWHVSDVLSQSMRKNA